MKPIGIFNNALSSLADGQQAQLQLDNFGRLIVTAGSGSAGAAGGAVQSVQGVGGGIALPIVAGAPTTSLYSAANVSLSASGDNTATPAVNEAGSETLGWAHVGSGRRCLFWITSTGIATISEAAESQYGRFFIGNVD